MDTLVKGVTFLYVPHVQHTTQHTCGRHTCGRAPDGYVPIKFM